MSEEFDKEAEREKLRKKFAEDEEKRSDTQRMSELLLQGATMTNKHCDNCGDPLFRDNGQTFCPTCADTDAEAAEPPRPEEGQSKQAPSQAQGAERQAGTTTERQTTEAGAGSARGGQQLPENAEVIARAGEQRGTPQPPQQSEQRGTPQPPESGAAADEPKAELRRAVTETARKASAATDPRTARAWLEASKEAAEALSALER